VTLTRVDQTILHSDPERPGNCFAACVASALGLNLRDVPHFIEWGMKHYGDGSPHPNGNTGAHWHAMFLGFLAGRDLWAIPLSSLDDAEPGELVFVGGPSPRGVPHQVLYRDGQLWHDPHPSKAGLLRIDEDDLFVIRPGTGHNHQPTSEETR
jgi:hypothetical protein